MGVDVRDGRVPTFHLAAKGAKVNPSEDVIVKGNNTMRCLRNIECSSRFFTFGYKRLGGCTESRKLSALFVVDSSPNASNSPVPH